MNADALAYLALKGLTLAEVIEFARIAERKKDPTNAERQARHRDSKRNGKVTRYSNGVTPPIEEIIPPSSHISPSGENENVTARAKPNPFPRPDWAEVQVWADWLDIRKSKKCRNTATAHAGFLADVAEHTDENWPPGALLRHAVRKSWASIHKPDEKQNGRSIRPADTLASLRGNRPSPALDMVLAAERELQAEALRENQGADWPPRLAIPSR